MNQEKIPYLQEKKTLLEVEKQQKDSIAWARDNKTKIEATLGSHGLLLIRGLSISDAEMFGEILNTIFGEELVNYTYRSTPRTSFKNNIYTATEYHANETIPQHNENSYANSWPLRIGFLCLQPATKMGNTPISDSREAYEKIPRTIREEFERKKVMYVRNYSNIDLPWTEVFQTENKNEVEAYCNQNDIKYEWTENGLRTSQINEATAIHPITGEKLWFNQAHLFHVSNLNKELSESLIELFGIEGLPRNAYFGDGTPIPDEMLSKIREVYANTKFSFQWKKHDLLLLDNMLFTHGREPYEGPRKVLVGMARPCSLKGASIVENS